MKKKLYIPIIVVLILAILFALSACSENTNKLYNIERKIHVSGKLKCVTEKEKYSADDTVIRYTITNVSDKEIGIPADSNCFELHKLVDGGWKGVSPNCDTSYNELARILKPGESVTREIKLDLYYYLPLEKGDYSVYVQGIYSNTFEIS